ncbi:MAG: DUF423 domain-containing protein [Lysobacterales bacterium]
MKGRWFAVLGALAAAIAVAGDAYGSHGLPGKVSAALVERFARAMHYLLLHGIALAAIGPRLNSIAERLSLATVALGMLLFSGALALSVLWPVWHWTRLAPVGGTLLIAGWLLLAVATLFRRGGG